MHIMLLSELLEFRKKRMGSLEIMEETEKQTQK